jgi:hypothetical protein
VRNDRPGRRTNQQGNKVLEAGTTDYRAAIFSGRPNSDLSGIAAKPDGMQSIRK